MYKNTISTKFKNIEEFSYFWYKECYWTKTTKENRDGKHGNLSNAFTYLYPWTFKLFDDDTEVHAAMYES